MKSADKYYIFTAEKERLNINVVSMDMCNPFIYYTTGYVSYANSKIVFCHFHIRKHMNMALAQVRNVKSRGRKLKDTLKDYELHMPLCAVKSLG